MVVISEARFVVNLFLPNQLKPCLKCHNQSSVRSREELSGQVAFVAHFQLVHPIADRRIDHCCLVKAVGERWVDEWLASTIEVISGRPQYARLQRESQEL
jgi:hypothetical protein